MPAPEVKIKVFLLKICVLGVLFVQSTVVIARVEVENVEALNRDSMRSLFPFHYDEFYDLDARQEILILSDGRDTLNYSDKNLLMRAPDLDLANTLSDFFPSKSFISGQFPEDTLSDQSAVYLNGLLGKQILIPGSHVGKFESGVLRLRVNNQTTLPFLDNSIDIVVLRNGLCQCKASRVGFETCGGIFVNLESALGFFREVIRVLDDKNPDAVAVLNGALQIYAPRQYDESIWLEAATVLDREFSHWDFKLQYFKVADLRFFNSLFIKPQMP